MKRGLATFLPVERVWRRKNKFVREKVLRSYPLMPRHVFSLPGQDQGAVQPSRAQTGEAGRHTGRSRRGCDGKAATRWLSSRSSPMVATINPLVGRMPGEQARDRNRERTQPWRKWYHSAEWKDLRMRVLQRDLFTCQICKRIERDTSKLIGDHKRLHHGERALFFDEGNV